MRVSVRAIVEPPQPGRESGCHRRLTGSESPAYTGRAIAALAADPQAARWSGQVLSSGQLARTYGFTDTDGTRPDYWRYIVEAEDPDLPADDRGYR